jgi:hypothetical protein
MASARKTWIVDPSAAGTATQDLQEIAIRDEIDRAFKKCAAVLAGIEVVFPDPPQSDPS